ATFSHEQIISWMVGRSLEEMFPKVPHTRGEPILDLRGLLPATDKEVIGEAGASFTLHRGEILGLAGIVGAGRTELLRAIFGLDPIRRGKVILHTIHGDNRAATPRRRIAQGI